LTAVGSILAAWLHPALWLALPVLLLEGGVDGLWVALLVVVAPLVARAYPAEPLPERASLLAVATLVVVVGLLLWANLVVVGDMAQWLGRPRWHGVALAAGGAFLLAVLPGAARTAPVLGLVALCAVGLSAVALVRVPEADPFEAWRRVAARPAFRFAATSPWVTTGRELVRPAPGSDGIVFDEEHRITAASAGFIRIRSQDGSRLADREWEMSPGQSVTLRPGDRLEAGSALKLRFEAGRRVPGAPVSGAAWARAGALEPTAGIGLALTLIGGAVALLRSPGRSSRVAGAVAGGGLLAALAWAEAWAIYGALAAPEVFLGRGGVARLLDLPGLALDPVVSELSVNLLLVGGAASLLASTVALRVVAARLAAGGADIGRDPGLWGSVLAVAGLASLWPADAWALVLVALGLGASAVAPMLLGWPAPRSGRGALGAGLVGLGLFLALVVAGRLGALGGPLAPLAAHPALLALPVAVLVRMRS
jgi:hypothetical protein